MQSVRSNAENLDVLKREEAVLAVIDVQERLLPAAADKQAVLDNIVRLVRFARIIDLPIVLTEQDKLGPTVQEIMSELDGLAPIVKITFDAFKCHEFVKRLDSLGRKTLIIAGLETHICISQTALSALGDFHVHVVADAVSSRTAENRRIGLDRVRQKGAVISSTEMVIYELLEKAGTDEFKATLKLVK